MVTKTYVEPMLVLTVQDEAGNVFFAASAPGPGPASAPTFGLTNQSYGKSSW